MMILKFVNVMFAENMFRYHGLVKLLFRWSKGILSIDVSKFQILGNYVFLLAKVPKVFTWNCAALFNGVTCYPI